MAECLSFPFQTLVTVAIWLGNRAGEMGHSSSSCQERDPRLLFLQYAPSQAVPCHVAGMAAERETPLLTPIPARLCIRLRSGVATVSDQ